MCYHQRAPERGRDFWGEAEVPPKSSTARSRRARKTAAQTPVIAAPAPVPVISPLAAGVSSLGVFLAVFVVYLLTLLPTVVNQDSGELVSAAHVLGVPHPTGYPFWTLLARLFDYLPVGHTSAYRIGLLSALSVALAAGIITWITIGLSGALLAGIFAGFAFAFWLPTWSQAVLAEVYGLEALLFGLFLLAFWWWEKERRPRRLLWVALAAGLVAMHHRTGALALLPALAVAFWLTRPRRLRVWGQAVLLAAAPFLCYLYLPIRAAARPPCNWGNPDTWERFIAHASGRQYAPWAFMNDFEAAMREAGRLLSECLASPGWPSWLLVAIGGPLLLWGLAHELRRRPAAIGSLAAGGALLAIWVLGYGDTSDSKVWLIPVGAVMALLGGLGLGDLARRLPGRAAGPTASAVLGATICLLLLFANWTRADRSNLWGHRDIWVATVTQCEPNGIFVSDTDAAQFITSYLQNVEGQGKDLTVLSSPSLWEEWYLGLLGEKDRELRRITEQKWKQTSREYDLTHPNTPDLWNGVARFPYLLAQHYRGRRAIYAPHPPITPFPAPPYFIGLKDGCYRLDFALPDLLRTMQTGSSLVALPDGVQLVSLTITPKEAKSGELVDFRARWRLEKPLPGILFALRLRPAQKALEPAWRKLLAKSCFQQGYPVVYGLWGLNASPPGAVYEQAGKYIIPSNAPPGDYRVEIGYAQGYPPSYGHWVSLGDRVQLRVRSQPLPTNGP